MGNKSRIALVTGGTRGIGAAIAEKLQRTGNTVWITGTAPTEKPKHCDRYFPVDFTDTEATAAFASEISAADIGILVNNAGINKIAPFEAIDPADFERIHKVNVHAPFLLCKAVIPRMKRAKWGRIVNISSVFGLVSREQRASYSTSKFGLDGMTLALALEVARDGILANCVAPGFIDTELTRKILGTKGIEEIVQTVPMKRLGRAEEIAEFVAWLASDANSYLTGQIIAVDGGFSRA